uniref:Uncharacterized protein n=1 Tax=Magallana gigas TaxID=29159 RepID=A0A8W8JEC9_MAGGI
MVKECKNLTGSTKVTCALQASSAILDLRNALSKELNIPQTLILIVDQENGTIFQDDIEIETLKQSPIEFILGNRNRTSIIEDDGSVENNVISNKNITYGKCKMSCGHFTGLIAANFGTKCTKIAKIVLRGMWVAIVRSNVAIRTTEQIVRDCAIVVKSSVILPLVAFHLKMDVELAIMVTDVSTNADIQTLGKHAKNVVSVPSPYAVLSLDVTPLDVRKPFQLV